MKVSVSEKLDLTESSLKERQFILSFMEEVIAGYYQAHIGNIDYIRFPQDKMNTWGKVKRWVKDEIIRVAASRGFVYTKGTPPQDVAIRLTDILTEIDGFNEFYWLLNNESSRRLAIKLLAFRVLGSRRIKLPLNTPQLWHSIDVIKRQLMKKPRTIPVQPSGWYLDYYELSGINFPVNLHAHTLNILDTFALQQYRYEKEGKLIEARLNDVVIDAGGCWGDSALYFAHKVGDEGRVYCFEFVPANLDVLEINLNLNPSLGRRVTIIPKAVWDKSEEHISYFDNGPGTSLVPDQGQMKCACATTIDDYVCEQGIERVDFIKLDIEGAELKALHGAEKTIRKFRPKMAVALYHRQDDFITIPDFLRSLELEYEFFLDHFTIHQEETVLFACPNE